MDKKIRIISPKKITHHNLPKQYILYIMVLKNKYKKLTQKIQHNKKKLDEKK